MQLRLVIEIMDRPYWRESGRGTTNLIIADSFTTARLIVAGIRLSYQGIQSPCPWWKSLQLETIY